MAPVFWDKFTGFFKKVGSGIKTAATKAYELGKKVVKGVAKVGAKALQYVKPALKTGLSMLGAKYGMDPALTGGLVDMGEGVLQAVGDVKPPDRSEAYPSEEDDEDQEYQGSMTDALSEMGQQYRKKR
jgi:hypothetical protein